VRAWLEKLATRLAILPRTVLSLTQLQYGLLARWAEGDFEVDYNAVTVPATGAVTNRPRRRLCGSTARPCKVRSAARSSLG
jgi:hypothetical protein